MGNIRTVVRFLQRDLLKFYYPPCCTTTVILYSPLAYLTWSTPGEILGFRSLPHKVCVNIFAKKYGIYFENAEILCLLVCVPNTKSFFSFAFQINFRPLLEKIPNSWEKYFWRKSFRSFCNDFPERRHCKDFVFIKGHCFVSIGQFRPLLFILIAIKYTSHLHFIEKYYR